MGRGGVGGGVLGEAIEELALDWYYTVLRYEVPWKVSYDLHSFCPLQSFLFIKNRYFYVRCDSVG